MSPAPTATATEPLAPDQVVEEAERIVGAATAHGEPRRVSSPDEPRPVRTVRVAAAAFLATAAAAWLAGGLVRGAMMPRALGLLGAAIGVGLVAASMRLARPAVLQYAVLPVSAFVGAVIIAPVASGGTANLPGLVAEAIQGGGLLQPPIPFDPGWRFILVVLFAIVGAASLSVALSSRQPKLAVAVPLPVVVGAALLQPSGSEIVASTVAIFMVIGALAVVYGSELTASADGSTRTFELRRLGRGMAMLVVLIVGMIGLAQTDFLFPDTNRDRIIPPQEPPQAPLEKDRELARVTGPRPGPWRVGVLDVYNGDAWLLPSVDPERVVEFEDGEIPIPADQQRPDDGEMETYEWTLVDMRGRNLPAPAGVTRIDGTDSTLEYDPRTGVPRLISRIPRGFSYTAAVPAPPTGVELNATPPPDAAVLAEFGDMPPAPNVVRSLLAEAPETRFDRLQFLRDQLFANVVAAGGGSPTAMPPGRVVEMLEPNAEATPFEITAAEAMLARWAGMPARIGFGYNEGDPIPGGFSLRPKHGAAWLEVYFEGYGWVPLVGTPPQAKSSLSEEQKNEDERVRPSDELALKVIIPVEQPSLLFLFEVLRYWAFRVLPVVAGLVLLWVGYPALFKLRRSALRRRWGIAHGPLGRTLVAYAELRDLCYDLNVGDVRHTPLEFVGGFTPDEEHDELSWLVTRLLWGDLRRDLRADDARAAEELASSVRRRLLGAQPFANRIVAWVTRASLRDPYTDDVPNLWPQLAVRDRTVAVLRGARRLVGRVVSIPRRRPVSGSAGVGVSLLLVALLVAGCTTQGGLTGADVAVDYPEGLVPGPDDDSLGYRFQREPTAEVEFDQAGDRALVTEGKVYTVHEGDVVQGSVQIALLRDDLDGTDGAVQAKIERAVGAAFRTYHIGPVRMRRRQLPEQTLYLWFPPDRNAMVTFAFRSEFDGEEDLLRALLARHRDLDPAQMEPIAELERPELTRGDDAAGNQSDQSEEGSDDESAQPSDPFPTDAYTPE